MEFIQIGSEDTVKRGIRVLGEPSCIIPALRVCAFCDPVPAAMIEDRFHFWDQPASVWRHKSFVSPRRRTQAFKPPSEISLDRNLLVKQIFV